MQLGCIAHLLLLHLRMGCPQQELHVCLAVCPPLWQGCAGSRGLLLEGQPLWRPTPVPVPGPEAEAGLQWTPPRTHQVAQPAHKQAPSCLKTGTALVDAASSTPVTWTSDLMMLATQALLVSIPAETLVSLTMQLVNTEKMHDSLGEQQLCWGWTYVRAAAAASHPGTATPR